MGFYNRETERQQLLKWSQQAADGQSSLTLMVECRRVGKMALLNETYRDYTEPSLYLFISRKIRRL